MISAMQATVFSKSFQCSCHTARSENFGDLKDAPVIKKQDFFRSSLPMVLSLSTVVHHISSMLNDTPDYATCL